MAIYGFGSIFHDLKYFELDLGFSLSLQSLYTWGYFCRKLSFQCRFIIFETLLVPYHHFHNHLHVVYNMKTFFPGCTRPHNLLGFVDQYVLEMFMIFVFIIAKVVYSLESFSLKRVQGSKNCPLDHACTLLFLITDHLDQFPPHHPFHYIDCWA